LTGTGRSRIEIRRFGKKHNPPGRHDDGDGPVIDV
jgi:hypothetical protein